MQTKQTINISSPMGRPRRKALETVIEMYSADTQLTCRPPVVVCPAAAAADALNFRRMLRNVCTQVGN